MRFVHIADVHLDTLYAARRSEVRDALRDASRQAFHAAVDLAIAEAVHAFLIAGDLFDGERLSFETERFILEQARRLDEAGIAVVYATGNHDPGGADYRLGRLAWPANVTIIRSAAPERVAITDRDGRPVGAVTAAGHETAVETRDLAATFPRPTGGGLPEVGLLHAQVVGARAADRHDRYAPAELDTLRRAGYDYWALGHVHLPQALSEDPPVWYAGCPQGTNPRETGPRGCLLVDLSDRGSPSVGFQPLATVRWETLRVDRIGDVAALEALAAVIRRGWAASRDREEPGARCEWMLRVELAGPCPLYRELRQADELAVLEDELVRSLDLLGAEVRDAGVHAPVDPAEHRERQDVLGEALRLLARAESDPVVLAAFRPERLAAEPDVGAEDDYLRGLLHGLDGELTARIRLPDAHAGADGTRSRTRAARPGQQAGQ